MIILYIISISCILFDNKEFSHLLDEKLNNKNLVSKEDKDNMRKEGIDNLIDNINTSESIKSIAFANGKAQQGGGAEKKDAGAQKPQAEGETKPGEKKQGGGNTPGEAKKEEGKPGEDKKDDQNVSIQQIKVKDKDAVLVKSQDGGEGSSIVVLADQELMNNEEELKKLPGALSGQSKSGDQNSQDKSQSGGQKPKEGAQKPQGGAQGGAQKPQGGAQGGEQKPQGGAQGREQKPQGGEQKPQSGGKGSPLLSLSPEESTQEGMPLKNTLDSPLFNKKDKDTESWITVLVNNEPKNIKVGVKTFTVLESVSQDMLKKDSDGISDKNLPNSQKIQKDAKENTKKKDDETKKKEEDAKKKEDVKNKIDEEAKKKSDDNKKKADDEVKKKADDNKKKADDEAKKKSNDNKKKADTDKNKETEKKIEEVKKKIEDAKKKDSTKKDDGKKTDDKKKKGDLEKVIEKSKEDITKNAEKNKNEIKKELGESKEDLKKDSKQNAEDIKKELDKNKPDVKKGIDKKSNKKDDNKNLKEIKYENSDFDSSNKAENEGIWSSIFSQSSDTKRLNGETTPLKSKDSKIKKKDADSEDNSKKALESVVFEGNDKELKNIKPKQEGDDLSKEKSQPSIDDLLYVIKNMPGKVNINKEGQKIFIEGDFKSPDSNDKKKNEFKFSGVIKSKSDQ